MKIQILFYSELLKVSIQETEFLNYLANKFNVDSNEIEFQRVGPTFGQEITTKGIRALVIFLSL